MKTMLQEKINILHIVILFSLAVQGMGQCSLKDMSIHQTKIGVKTKRPLWKVTITNNCYCSQSNIKIACTGNRTLKEAVDPSIVKIAKGKVLVRNGEPIYPYTSVGFTYASSLPLQFKLLSSQVACS